MNRATMVTLLAIGLVLGGMAVSFIWFVATWDRDAEAPIVKQTPPEAVQTMEVA